MCSRAFVSFICFGTVQKHRNARVDIERRRWWGRSPAGHRDDDILFGPACRSGRVRFATAPVTAKECHALGLGSICQSSRDFGAHVCTSNEKEEKKTTILIRCKHIVLSRLCVVLYHSHACLYFHVNGWWCAQMRSLEKTEGQMKSIQFRWAGWVEWLAVRLRMIFSCRNMRELVKSILFASNGNGMAYGSGLKDISIRICFCNTLGVFKFHNFLLLIILHRTNIIGKIHTNTHKIQDTYIHTMYYIILSKTDFINNDATKRNFT